MAERAVKGMPAILSVVRCKLSSKSSAGFTFLELLVVLSILGVMVSIVTPNLSSFFIKDSAQHEAFILQQSLQKLVDESWLEQRNHFIEFRDVSAKETQLVLWQRQNDHWQIQTSIYTLDSELTYQLETSSSALNQAKQSLSAVQNSRWVVFSNGEYLPFRLQIKSPSSTYTLVGDGINGIRIEP